MGIFDLGVDVLRLLEGLRRDDVEVLADQVVLSGHNVSSTDSGPRVWGGGGDVKGRFWLCRFWLRFWLFSAVGCSILLAGRFSHGNANFG